MKILLFRNKLIFGILFLFIGMSLSPAFVSSSVEKQNNNPIDQFSSDKSDVDWWSMFHHDPQNSGYSTTSISNLNNTLWQQNFSDIGFIGQECSPIVQNNKLYIYTRSKLICMDADTGDNLWNYSVLVLGKVCSPAIANDKIYFGTGDLIISDQSDRFGEVKCLNVTDGSEIWNYTTGDYVSSSPIVFNDRVYIGSDDDYLYCFDADPSDGADVGYNDPEGVNYDLIWSFYSEGDIIYSPAYYNGYVYTISERACMDRELYCLNASTGEEVWSLLSKITTSPVVVNGKLYFGKADIHPQDPLERSYIICIDAYTQQQYWSYLVPKWLIYSTPAVFEDRVYFVSTNGTVYCINSENGNFIWDYDTNYDGLPAYGCRTSPAITDNKVFVLSDQTIYCFTSLDGTPIWEYEFEGAAYWYSSPTIANGKLYVAVEDSYYGPLKTVINAFEGGTNEAPNAPIITGESNSIIGEECEFTFTTIDPDDNLFYYYIEWGDGNNEEWIGPYESGNQVLFSHSWSEPGTYNIRAKAKDVNNASSVWSDQFLITINDKPNLSIETISGGKIITFVIKNNGEGDANAVQWRIYIYYGLFVNPRLKSGIINKLEPGESEVIAMSVFGIGLGILRLIPLITFEVSCSHSYDVDSVEAKILFRKVIIQ